MKVYSIELTFLEPMLGTVPKNKDVYTKQDGYLHRLWASLITGNRLIQIAKAQKRHEIVRSLSTQMSQLDKEQKDIHKGKRW